MTTIEIELVPGRLPTRIPPKELTRRLAEHRAPSRIAYTAQRVACEDCGEVFADEDTLDAHRRPEPARKLYSAKFLTPATLPACYSPSTLWSIGWRRSRPEKVWSKPPMPKKRPHKVDDSGVYHCVACSARFKDAAPFMAHYVHTFTPIERCLDADELRALDFEQSKSGIWRITIATQYLPSQIARLATVRQELEAFTAAETAKRELAETTGTTPTNNI